MGKVKRKVSPGRLPLSMFVGATLIAIALFVGNAVAFAPRADFVTSRRDSSDSSFDYATNTHERRTTALDESALLEDPIVLDPLSSQVDDKQQDISLPLSHKAENGLTELLEGQIGVAQFHENIRWIENRLASKKCGYSWNDIEDVVGAIHATAAGTNLEQIEALLNLTDIIKLLLETCEATKETSSSSLCAKEILLGCIWHFSESNEAQRRGLLESDFILHNVLLRHENCAQGLQRQKTLPSRLHSSIEMDTPTTKEVVSVTQTFESMTQMQSQALATSPIPAMTLCPSTLPNDGLKFDAWTVARCAARMKRIELLSRAAGSPRLSHADADYVRHLLLTVEGFDWRALMVRCIFNLQVIEAGSDRSTENLRAAREGLLIFGPLASMLGLYQLKAEIEDNAFRFLYPRQYRAAGSVFGNDNDSIESVSSFLGHHIQALLHTDKLLQDQVEHLQVSSRVKERYSFWKKLIRNKAESLSLASIRNAGLADSSSQLVPWDSSLIDQVPDAVALRVVLRGRSSPMESTAAKEAKDKLLCYYVQEKLRSRWPVWDPLRTKDYIRAPKPNTYQSLHYTSSIQVGENHLPFEVQVRSHDMHIAAEFGSASHSLYKISSHANATDTLSLARQDPTMAVHTSSSPLTYGYLDFLERTRAALSGQHTIVFVANSQRHSSEIVCLPNKSRVADVIAVLRETSNSTPSLFVNGRRSELNDSVENGDVVLLLGPDANPITNVG